LDRFELETTIPANTTAKVYVPAVGEAQISEIGKPLAKVRGVKFQRLAGDRAVLAVESGNYKFVSRL